MAYRNSSGWDDSGAHINVRLGQGDTYRHNGVEYAHDGLPINNSRDENLPPRPRRETRAGDTNRPSQPAGRPRAETQTNRRTLRDLYEENPPPPRPRYTEEDERREYNASRSAQNARDQSGASRNYAGHNRRDPTPAPRDYYPENHRRSTPPPASQTYRSGPAPGSYAYYLNDNEYHHNTAHLYGHIARTRDLFSPLELVQYREYDEQYYAGTRRSPIHGREGHYGDNLRHERYIAGGPHYAEINPRRRQPFFNPIPPLRSNFSALDEPSPLEVAEAQGHFAHRGPLYGPSPLEVAEAQGLFAHRDPWDGPSPLEVAEAEGRWGARRYDGRYDAGDPCPDPSVHNGRHGICFARRDAGYPG